MASGTKTDGEIAPSEVSVSVGKGVRLTESETNDLADFAAEACDTILSSNGRSQAMPSRVDVRIAANAEMRRLNRDFRGKDKPTDVISFPAADAGRGSIAGDIAISAPIAASSARRLGHSRVEELKILVLHGMLHLAGHDHETDRGKMARLESSLRAQLQLPGSLIDREAQPPSAARRRARRTRSAR